MERGGNQGSLTRQLSTKSSVKKEGKGKRLTCRVARAKGGKETEKQDNQKLPSTPSITRKGPTKVNLWGLDCGVKRGDWKTTGKKTSQKIAEGDHRNRKSGGDKRKGRGSKQEGALKK